VGRRRLLFEGRLRRCRSFRRLHFDQAGRTGGAPANRTTSAPASAGFLQTLRRQLNRGRESASGSDRRLGGLGRRRTPPAGAHLVDNQPAVRGRVVATRTLTVCVRGLLSGIPMHPGRPLLVARAAWSRPVGIRAPNRSLRAEFWWLCAISVCRSATRWYAWRAYSVVASWAACRAVATRPRAPSARVCASATCCPRAAV
jgi:hypothetical protein